MFIWAKIPVSVSILECIYPCDYLSGPSLSLIPTTTYPTYFPTPDPLWNRRETEREGDREHDQHRHFKGFKCSYCSCRQLLSQILTSLGFCSIFEKKKLWEEGRGRRIWGERPVDHSIHCPELILLLLWARTMECCWVLPAAAL